MKTLVYAGKDSSPKIQSHAAGWHHAFSLRSDCESRLWNGNENISSFDIFDTYKPDVFWCHSSDLNRSIVKVLLDKNFDETKAIIFLSDMENAKEDEVKFVEQLSAKYKTMFSRNFEKYLPDWKGVRECLSCLPAADITRFKPKELNLKYSKDITFIGQWHSAHLELYKKYLFPYLDIGLKIYGFGNWPVANHLGSIKDDSVLCDIMSSSKNYRLCINTKSPSETIFKILACEGECVILGANEDYQEFFKRYCWVDTGIAQEINKRKTYSWIVNKHTYFQRVTDTFQKLEIS